MERLEILPQTIYKFKCDKDLLEKTFNLLNKEEWIVAANGSKFKTKNVRLEKTEEYLSLHNWFHSCLNQVKCELDFQCEYLKITQSWGNKEKLNQWHHGHTHPNSIISGLLYVTNSNASTWFSLNSMWSGPIVDYYEEFKLLFEEKRLIYNQPSVAGDLIIFPSRLCHGVGEHKNATEDRYTISFNSFPCGKIGNYDYLSGLEIDIK